jgi:hypothetical protein
MAALASAAVLGTSLSGCVSTQHKNARAKLVAERVLEGRKPLWLGGRSREVRVLHVARVRGRHGGALVVTLRNRGERSLTDVPIVVGVLAADGRRTELNDGHGLAWFQTHVPAIGAGETTTWVYTTRRPLPTGRAWAVAGQARTARALPRIATTVERVTVPARRGAKSAAVRVALVNGSDVPQFGLQVYAVVRAHGRVVAAGASTVRHLGSRASGSARVALFGAPGRHAARVHALPTIFD